MSAPKYTTRKGAAKGEPSMLWIGKSGRYYRNIVDSKTDKAINAIGSIAPDGGIVKRPPVTPATKPETNNVFFYLIAILAILILIKIMK